MKKIKTIRVYDIEDAPKEGRVLIDRIWLRGISKEKLKPFYGPKILPLLQIWGNGLSMRKKNLKNLKRNI